MENQQESLVQERELGWLGGIFDGEGTITIRIRNRKGQSDLLTPVVTVSNTDRLMIDKIIEIYKKLSVPFWVTNYKAKGNWKESWKIEITGIKRCKKILPILKTYLVNKKELAELVLDWCNSRINSLGKREFYSDEDIEIVKYIKSKHGHKLALKSSETTR